MGSMYGPPQRLFDADQYATLDAAAERVRQGYLLAYRGHTRRTYETGLRLWFRWCADRAINPLEVERSDIETYDLDMQGAGSRPATRQQRLIVICGMYNWAEQEGILVKSPGRYVRRPRVPQDYNGAILERYEVGPFLAAARDRGPYHSALCHLLVYNGLRIGEAVASDIEDLAFAGGHRILTIIRKGGARVDVPLAAPTFRAALLAIGERDSGPLILDGNNSRMTRHSGGRAVRLVARRAGIAKTLGPHALRRTWVSLGLDAGIPLRDMQRDAGHAHPSTTARYDRRGQNLDRHATYTITAFVGASG